MNVINSFRQRPGHWSRTIALILLIGPFVAAPAFAEPIQVFDLGIEVSPEDISNNGTIVGSRKTNTGTVAFRLLPGSPLEDITTGTVANAVNEYDQIAGNTSSGAFLLTNDAITEWNGYGGYGLNEAGQISGNLQLDNPYRTTPLPLDPAIYTPDQWANLEIATVYPRGTREGVYADLYTLDDINDYGYAVGSRSRYGLVNSSSSILTTPDFDTVTYLPVPYGGYATAINNNHLVVGATGSNSATDTYPHAYLYNYTTGELQDLGTLKGGLTSSAADINDFDQVVGTSWLVSAPTSLYDPTLYHAFLWKNGVMIDLNDLISPDSGWVLTAATAINDNGDIVGTGVLNGEIHGFMLPGAGTQNPPPPLPANKPPVAVTTSNVTSGKAPLTVNFSAASSYDPDGHIISYSWNFGDGGSAAGVYASHTYTTTGTYTAILTVTDDAGDTDTARVEITVRKSKGKSKGRR